jgi:hypothetical protein
MVDNRQFRSDRSDVNDYDDDFDQPRTRRYAFGRSADQDSVPLFLSDPDSEPDPAEFSNPLRPRRTSISLRILIAVVAASGVAMLFAWFTSDATRDVLVSAKASLSTILPIPSTAAQAEASPGPQAASTQLTAHDAELKDPARWQGPGAQPQTPPIVRTQVAMAPSREDISSAYQSALQTRPAPPAVPPQAAVAPSPAAPQALAAAPPVAVPPVATPPARQLDAEEIALLMKRAKDLLASGDIPPARLLLRRAADAREAAAALILAQTYDPDVLGTQDVRNINPDSAMARTWYQKAAQLGSAEAQRRLAQLQN